MDAKCIIEMEGKRTSVLNLKVRKTRFSYFWLSSRNFFHGGGQNLLLCKFSDKISGGVSEGKQTTSGGCPCPPPPWKKARFEICKTEFTNSGHLELYAFAAFGCQISFT